MRCLMAAGLSMMLSACASMSPTSLFSHYSAAHNEVHQALEQGNYEKALSLQYDQTEIDILSDLELGRLGMLASDHTTSFEAFQRSDLEIKELQRKAQISLTDSVSTVGAIAINDNVTRYEPTDYELGFLHLYLGLSYLQKNDLEGALIEMRRANQVQEAAKKAREASLANAEEEMSAQGISANVGSVLAKYPNAPDELSAVQNGYLFYLSALLFEADGDLNSAYVDYRRALAILPKNQAVIDSTIRTARKLGMSQDLKTLTARYGSALGKPSRQGRVIVIEEQGVVSAMSSWRLDLPLFDTRGNTAIYSLSLPYYKDRSPAMYSPLKLNTQSVKGDSLADVDHMARYALQEALPSTVIRQALRVWAKDRIRKETTRGDEIGNLIFNIWNTLTEQPDTRSWQTLPAEVLAYSQLVTPGEQQLQLGNQTYRFNVESNNTVLVWLSRQGSQSNIWHKQLGRL